MPNNFRFDQLHATNISVPKVAVRNVAAVSNSDKAIPGLTVVVVIYEHGSADSIDGTSYKGNPERVCRLHRDRRAEEVD